MERIQFARFAGAVIGAGLTTVAVADAGLTLEFSPAETSSLFGAPPVGQDENVVALSAMQDESSAAKEWEGKFVLGLSGASGNSENLGGAVSIDMKRENDYTRLLLDTAYFYGSSNGDRDNNRFTLGARHDWKIPGSKWFYFAQARFDIDEFQSWDERLGLHGGVGYELVTRDDYQCRLRAGLGTIREWGSTNDNWRLEGLVGFDVIWDITDKQQFVAGSTYYPDFDETGEFRLVSYAGWSATIDDESNMSVNARVEQEHQSRVDPGRDRNDWRVVAGVGFNF